MTLIDDINRLFDELVHHPWSRARAVVPPGSETVLDLEIPIPGGQLADISVSLQGRRLVVRARRPSTVSGGVDEAAGPTEELERTLVLPDTAEVTGIEARVAGEVLHVRVCLRSGSR